VPVVTYNHHPYVAPQPGALRHTVGYLFRDDPAVKVGPALQDMLSSDEIPSWCAEEMGAVAAHAQGMNQEITAWQRKLKPEMHTVPVSCFHVMGM
jgi:hypothetical protein